MYYAFTIYASINKGVAGQQLVRPRVLSRRLPGSSSAALGGGSSSGGVQPLRHLSLTLPVSGGGQARADGSLLQTIRERFDKATMVQVGARGVCLEDWSRDQEQGLMHLH